LVELCALSGNHHSLNWPFIINSKSLKQTFYVMWLLRGMLHSTDSTNFLKYSIFSSWTKFLRGP